MCILNDFLPLMCLDGCRRNGSIVPKPAAAWAFRSALFAACSSSMMEPTAPSTASTAVARNPRAAGPATESRVPPTGGPERGRRFSIHDPFDRQSFVQMAFPQGANHIF